MQTSPRSEQASGSFHIRILAPVSDDAVIRNESLVERDDRFPLRNDPGYSVKEGIAALTAHSTPFDAADASGERSIASAESEERSVIGAAGHGVSTARSLKPFVCPEIEDVVQVDIGQERRDHALNAKDNFRTGLGLAPVNPRSDRGLQVGWPEVELSVGSRFCRLRRRFL